MLCDVMTADMVHVYAHVCDAHLCVMPSMYISLLAASNTVRIEYHVYRLILYLSSMLFLCEYTSSLSLPISPLFPFLQIMTACVMRWRWYHMIGVDSMQLWDQVLVYGTATLALVYVVG